MLEKPNNRDKFATFFLSTGRCGTQWLADSLGGTYADVAHVEHEPYQDINLARHMLGTNDPAKIYNPDLLFDHISKIKKVLETKDYIECGWPCWGLLCWLAKELDGRMRVVHLVRHPVYTVYSWVSNNAYAPPIIPGLPGGKAPVQPSDEGVSFPEYIDRWEDMGPFDKCLYFWLELNSLGLRLENELHLPWLRVKSEDIFKGDALKGLIDFLNLPQRDAIYNLLSETKDDHRFSVGSWWDYRNIREHPDVIGLCEKLGYDPLDVDEARLRGRYLGIF